MKFGEGLRAWREARGLTQRELARRLEVRPALVSDYERGQRSPTLRQFQRIMFTLEAWPCELLGRPCPPTQLRGRLMELHNQVHDLERRLQKYERHGT